MTAFHKNMGKYQFGTHAVVAEINGEMCQCGHHDRPHHNPKFSHGEKSPFRRHPVKLLSNVERSGRCRMRGCNCLGFRLKRSDTEITNDQG